MFETNCPLLLWYIAKLPPTLPKGVGQCRLTHGFCAMQELEYAKITPLHKCRKAVRGNSTPPKMWGMAFGFALIIKRCVSGNKKKYV